MRSGMIKRSKVGNHISQSTRFVAPTAVDAPFSDSGAFDSAEIQGRPVCSAMNGKDFAAYERCLSALVDYPPRRASSAARARRCDISRLRESMPRRRAARFATSFENAAQPSSLGDFYCRGRFGGATDLANERHHRVARSRRTRRGSHLSRARAAYVLSSPVEAFCRDSQHDLLGDLLHEARGRRYVIDGLSNFQ